VNLRERSTWLAMHLTYRVLNFKQPMIGSVLFWMNSCKMARDFGICFMASCRVYHPSGHTVLRSRLFSCSFLCFISPCMGTLQPHEWLKMTCFYSCVFFVVLSFQNRLQIGLELNWSSTCKKRLKINSTCPKYHLQSLKADYKIIEIKPAKSWDFKEISSTVVTRGLNTCLPINRRHFKMISRVQVKTNSRFVQIYTN